MNKEFLDAILDYEDEEIIFGLAIGGIDEKGYFAEAFYRIEKEDDVPNMKHWEIRARYNQGREYKMYYFRVQKVDFEEIHNQFKKNNRKFAKWLNTSKSITWQPL
jgi:hypothetical protein